MSELKRTHGTKIDSRTWAKGRAALAELAQNGRAIKGLFAQVLCAQNPMYIVLELVFTGHFTSLLDHDAEEAAASQGTFRGCDFSPEYLYARGAAQAAHRNGGK